jgi:hypothetical protein
MTERIEVVTDARVAREVVDYAESLEQHARVDHVEVPVLGTDGTVRRLGLDVGSGHRFVLHEQGSAPFDLGAEPVLRELRARKAALERSRTDG